MFFFFFNSVLHPFQDYFSSYETGQSVGGRKQENPEKNHLVNPESWPVPQQWGGGGGGGCGCNDNNVPSQVRM